MGTFSIWHWVIVLVVVLVLFGGRGKLSSMMGDMAKGINAFKKGLKDGEGEGTDKVATDAPKPIENEAQAAVAESREKDEATKR